MDPKKIYIRKISKDLRITMPINLVDDLRDGYIMLGDNKSLRIINKSQLQEIRERFDQETDDNTKRALAFLIRQSIQFSMDNRNRFKISLMHKNYIGAKDFVSITKIDNFIEVSAKNEKD